jgi:hypothetical protein
MLATDVDQGAGRRRNLALLGMQRRDERRKP